MGWATVPKPGTPYGPCEDPCQHTDCAATREDAASICHHCGRAIGYEVAYYRTTRGLVHARCELEAADRSQKDG